MVRPQFVSRCDSGDDRRGGVDAASISLLEGRGVEDGHTGPIGQCAGYYGECCDACEAEVWSGKGLPTEGKSAEMSGSGVVAVLL